jgi:hypothetical protein
MKIKERINKLFSLNIPEEWCHEDSFFFNFMNLIFWAIGMGAFLFLMSLYL